eukprot:277022_1
MISYYITAITIAIWYSIEAFTPTFDYMETMLKTQKEFMENTDIHTLDAIVNSFADDAELCFEANCTSGRESIRNAWKPYHGVMDEAILNYTNVNFGHGWFHKQWIGYIRKGDCEANIGGYTFGYLTQNGQISHCIEWYDNREQFDMQVNMVVNEECKTNNTVS